MNSNLFDNSLTQNFIGETGGLRDSVPPYNKYTGEGRGFSFTNVDSGDLFHVLTEAVELYHTDTKAWRKLQKAGMTADFTWNNSAKLYLDIYRQILG